MLCSPRQNSATQAVFGCAEQKEIRFRAERRTGDLRRLFLAAQLFDDAGQLLAHFDSRLDDVMLGDSSTIEGTFTFEHPWLKPGKYRIDLYILTIAVNEVVDRFEHACTLVVAPLYT